MIRLFKMSLQSSKPSIYWLDFVKTSSKYEATLSQASSFDLLLERPECDPSIETYPLNSLKNPPSQGLKDSFECCEVSRWCGIICGIRSARMRIPSFQCCSHEFNLKSSMTLKGGWLIDCQKLKLLRSGVTIIGHTSLNSLLIVRSSLLQNQILSTSNWKLSAKEEMMNCYYTKQSLARE